MGSAFTAELGFLFNAPARRSPNGVRIVVESWGLSNDARLADALDSGYGEPSMRAVYRVQSGTIPFIGLTVPGEARKLCQSSIGFGILNPSASEKKRFLPAVFHQHGYEDIAVHGCVGAMFSRNDWYRTRGFDERWYKPELARAGLSVCNGVLPGICDTSVAGWIGHDLLAVRFRMWYFSHRAGRLCGPDSRPRGSEATFREGIQGAIGTQIITNAGRGRRRKYPRDDRVAPSGWCRFPR